MARGLVWSPEAIEDIESITSYIERDSAWHAKAVASKIVETAETIPQYPELGRIVPEIGDAAIRERFVYSYRIITVLTPSGSSSPQSSMEAACCTRPFRE